MVVVSDGCSSSPHTDLGARLLAWSAMSLHAVRKLRDDYANADEFIFSTIHAASNARVVLGSSPQPLDATLLVAQHYGDRWWVRIWGDGVVAVRHKSGHIDMWRMEWETNMPPYPFYLDPSRYHDYQQLLSIGKYHEKLTSTPPGAIFHSSRPAQQGVGYARCVERRSYGTIHDSSFNPFDAYCPGGGPLQHEDIDLVALFSDGVGSIPGILWHEAVATLMAFKGPLRGDFVKRRVRAALREWAKDGRAPEDDLSMAAVGVFDED